MGLFAKAICMEWAEHGHTCCYRRTQKVQGHQVGEGIIRPRERHGPSILANSNGRA